jgi:hypothetical protein
LRDHFIWSGEIISTSKDPFLLIGVLSTLTSIFKRGKRQELLELIPLIFKDLINIQANSVTRQKLLIKLIQRIGLTFLKPRVAPWRYQRGFRSLLQNLEKQPQQAINTTAAASPKEEDVEEDIDIPEEIEEIIDYLLKGLKDKVNVYS